MTGTELGTTNVVSCPTVSCSCPWLFRAKIADYMQLCEISPENRVHGKRRAPLLNSDALDSRRTRYLAAAAVLSRARDFGRRWIGDRIGTGIPELVV
jgi:hypothetical protein